MNLDMNSIEFSQNPQRRCPCVIIADVSDSMFGDPIDELNNGIKAYQSSVTGNELASSRVEVALVTFGDAAKVYQHRYAQKGHSFEQPFVTVEKFEPPQLETSGMTAMGMGIHAGLDLLARRKQEYRAAGVSYYRPWVILLTDGAPTDDWRSAAQRLAREQQEKKFQLFVIAVGDRVDLSLLRDLAGGGTVFRLKGLNFVEFFCWLSTSQQMVSTEQQGTLPPRNDWENVRDWQGGDERQEGAIK